MKKNNFLISIFFILFLTSGCRYDKAELLPCNPVDVRFTRDVKPIIQANCATPSCHNGTSYLGDFSTYAGLLVHVQNGSFRARVINIHAMPPVDKLSDCDYKKLEVWLDAGAQDN